MNPTPEFDYFAKRVELLNVSVEEYLEKASSLVESSQATPFERTMLKSHASLLVSQRLQSELLASILSELRTTT